MQIEICVTLFNLQTTICKLNYHIIVFVMRGGGRVYLLTRKDARKHPHKAHPLAIIPSISPIYSQSILLIFKY